MAEVNTHDASPAAEPEALDHEGAGQRAVRGSILRSGGYVLGVLMSIVSAPLIIRHLGVEDFGLYVTIMAMTTIVAGVGDLGLTSLGVREWAVLGPQDRRELIRDLLGARLVFSAAGTLVVLGIAVASGYDSRSLAAAAVACAALLVVGLQGALTVPLAGQLQQGWIAAADLVRQALLLVIVVALVLVGGGLVPLMAASIVASAGALVVTVIPKTNILVLPALRPRRWSALLTGSLPFVAASALSVIYLRSTVVLTSFVSTAEQNGYFAIAFRVLEVLINVPALIFGAVFPLLVRSAADSLRMRNLMEPLWRGSLAAGAIAGVLVSAGAPIAVLILSGDGDSDAVDALRLLGVALGFSFVGAFGQYSLLAVRANREILIVNGVAFTVNVLLTLWLAAAHGAVGAAVALTVAEMLGASLSIVLLRRRVDTDGLPLGVVARAAAVLAVGAAVALAMVPVGDLAVAVAAPLAAAVTAVVIGLVPPAIWAALPLPGKR